jgi:hypothetical protein
MAKMNFGLEKSVSHKKIVIHFSSNERERKKGGREMNEWIRNVLIHENEKAYESRGKE